MSEQKEGKKMFDMKELPCEKVVVFTDRAEIRRLLKTKLNNGENELTIKNVSSFIDQDSVRVEGKGNATVLDVSCQTKRVEKTESSTHEKVKQFQNEIKDLESKIASIISKLERVNKQTNVLNEFANSLAKLTSRNSVDSKDTKDPKENIDTFLGFLETYSEKLSELDDQKFQIEKEKQTFEEKLRVANENLSQLSVYNYNDSTDITILVESASKNEEEVFLFVSYVVYNASWTPKYDIRVFSKEKSMTINYYGMICQSTGEDWTDTKISLSTAVPSIGGKVPELETQNIRIKPKPVPVNKSKGFAFGASNGFSQSAMMAPRMMAMRMDAMPMVQECSTIVNQSNIGSTATFEIARTTSIPADNIKHKVSIGIIELKPDFEYESVPQKNAYAYLKAKVINKSNYSMLAGPANVFLDNNFVSKTELKSYSPQEEFTCSLGVDPAIRIDYKPVKKFKNQTGILSKYANTVYEQVIEVKNTSPNSAKILVVDSIPLSTDDKIIVRILEPNLKNNQQIRLNKSNNIEFDLNMPSSKIEELTIKYSIEHPYEEETELF